jgi:hypothetical protein
MMMISKQVKKTKEEEEEERTGMVWSLWTNGAVQDKGRTVGEYIYKIKVKTMCESLLRDKLPCRKIVVIKTREAQNIRRKIVGERERERDQTLGEEKREMILKIEKESKESPLELLKQT